MTFSLADRQGIEAGFAAARFFLVDDEMHIVLQDAVPCGLPIPDTFYDLKATKPSDPPSEWGVCPTCHFAFVPTMFREVSPAELFRVVK